MPRSIPSLARRQYLLQKSMKCLGLKRDVGELFEVLDDLFVFALTPTYLLHDDADNPLEHHTTVLGNMMEIATGEGLDWSTVRQAAAIALLHDIWPVRKITSDRIRNAPDHEKAAMEEERKDSVPIHQQEGSAHAREILDQLNQKRGKVEYDAAAIERICSVIAIHDNPRIGIPIPTADTLAVAFREADRLWMQDPWGVGADLARKGNNYPSRRDRLAQAQENVRSFHEERAKAYAAFPPAHFIDAETLFRTNTGHRIFGRLRRYWEFERLRTESQAVEADADH